MNIGVIVMVNPGEKQRQCDRGFLRREPRAGKLARGVPKRGRGW